MNSGNGAAPRVARSGPWQLSCTLVDERLEDAKEHAWREVRAIDTAYERGAIDDDEWHRQMAGIVVPLYPGAETPQGGSGHRGTSTDWEWSRGIVAEALHREGSFLDVGCANGLLMQSVVRWGAARGVAIEPYGLEIAREIAELARRRLPEWAARVHVGNALGWKPPMRFDFVRTGLEYVPRPRRRELAAWLLEHVVAPGGRLVIGKLNEEVEDHATEQQLGEWGFAVAGRAERAHRTEPRLAYRILWIDA